MYRPHLSERASARSSSVRLVPIIAICAVGSAVSSSDAQTQSALAAYSFNASSGSTLLDVSGGNNTVNLQNGPLWSSGRYGNALSFDGANDRGVAAAANSALNFTNNRFTVSAWINPRSNSGYQMIVNKPAASSHSSPYFDWSMHRQASTGRLAAWLGCDRRQRTSNGAIPLNAWTHVAITYDGAAVRHYINGTLDRTTSLSCSIPNTSSRPIRVGANGGGGEVMNGLIDDVRLYGRALSASEIQADMTNALGGGGSPTPAAPTLSLGASPTFAPSGTATTLSWSSANATACSASGGWSGSRAVSGSFTTGALSTTTTFTLTCTGGGGTVSRSATVTIASGTPAPTVTLSASPSSVSSGGTTNLSWSSTNASSCSASGAWSGSRPTSGSASSSALSAASNTFTLACTGSSGTVSRSATVAVQGSSAQSGLDFPGSAATSGTVRFRFTNPLAIYPATYVWKLYPRHQLGYYTTFFWGNDGEFAWNRGGAYSADSFYGAHPYPPGTGSSGTTHKWEIASRSQDYVSAEFVEYNRWYTQALRVWSDASGKHHEFYWDLPNTSRVIRVTQPASYGNAMPPHPALTFGDAPWNPSREIMHGVLRGIQIYSSSLSVQDIQNEIASPLSTSTGSQSIWYMNLDPTPSDISDKSGRGHDPQWVGSERARLWSN